MVQVLQKKLHQISLFHEIRYQEPTETMESNKSILLMISLLFFKESKASIPELIPLILWFMNQLFDQLNWAEKPYMWLVFIVSIISILNRIDCKIEYTRGF